MADINIKRTVVVAAVAGLALGNVFGGFKACEARRLEAENTTLRTGFDELQKNVRKEAALTLAEGIVLGTDRLSLVGDCTKSEDKIIISLSEMQLPVCIDGCGNQGVAVGPLLNLKAQRLSNLLGEPLLDVDSGGEIQCEPQSTTPLPNPSKSKMPQRNFFDEEGQDGTSKGDLL